MAKEQAAPKEEKKFVFPTTKRKLTFDVIEKYFKFQKKKGKLPEEEYDAWIAKVESIERNDTEYPTKAKKNTAIKHAFIEKYCPQLDKDDTKTPITDRFKALKDK